MSDNFASYLQNHLKLQKNDRIAIMLPNVHQYIIAMLGGLKAGLIIVNVNPMYTKRELTNQLLDADVNTIVILKNFAHTLESALPDVKIKHIIITEIADFFDFPKNLIINFVVKYVKKLIPKYNLPQAIAFNKALKIGSKKTLSPVKINIEDTAFLQYTGGTTGVAKGAILTHRNICANALQGDLSMAPAYTPGVETVLLPLPLYHIYSLQMCFIYMNFGAEITLITDPRNIPDFVNLLSKKKISYFVGLNTLFRALLLNQKFRKLDFSGFKYTVSGAMATSSDVAADWKKVTGINLSQGYGLTEASPIVCFCSYNDREFDGSVGYPVPSTEIKVIDQGGNEVPIGEIGELCVKGPQVMKGYLNKPEETRKVLSPDGWLKTGDLVKLDKTGKITIVDREKDMITVSGFKVYPNEVEDVLTSHPGILEAAVVGEPDEAHGEVVKAFIVLKNKHITEKDILEYCHELLTNYKVPKIIVFIKELPKTAVGKTLRRALRGVPMEAKKPHKNAA
jgi:long-chain acyl-CoA synthetase